MHPLRPLAALLAVIVLSACGPIVPEDARAREVVQLQHRLLWSGGELDRIDDLYTEDAVIHFPDLRVEGPDALAAAVAAHRRAFPDWSENVEMLVVEGNRVASRYTATGTHSGEYLGIPATGRRVQIDEAALFVLEDGRISEQWVYPDLTSLERQLRE